MDISFYRRQDPRPAAKLTVSMHLGLTQLQRKQQIQKYQYYRYILAMKAWHKLFKSLLIMSCRTQASSIIVNVNILNLNFIIHQLDSGLDHSTAVNKIAHFNCFTVSYQAPQVFCVGIIKLGTPATNLRKVKISMTVHMHRFPGQKIVRSIIPKADLQKQPIFLQI